MVSVVAALAGLLFVGPADLESDLRSAVVLWKRFGMPVPGPSAKPALLNKWTPAIGFVEPNSLGQLLVYVGTEKLPADQVEHGLNVMDWSSWWTKGIRVNFLNWARFPEDTTMASVVQSAAMGHKGFAESLVLERRAQKDFRGPDSEWLGVPVDGSVRAATALLIETHFANELFKPESDWKAIRNNLADLAKLKLIKPSDGYARDRSLESLISELDASLVPCKADPDSPEAAVAALSQWKSPRAQYSIPAEDPLYQRIKAFGLKSVPALANELGGRRLTHTFRPRRNNEPGAFFMVRWIAEDLLRDIADGELGRWVSFTQADVIAWYKAKLSGNVEAYLMNSLFEVYQSRGKTHRLACRRTFDAIALRHPHLLREAIRRVHEANVDTGIAISTVDEAKLSNAEKREILVDIVMQSDLDQRSNAMWDLHHIDRAAFDQALIETFRNGPAVLNRDFAYFACFATGTNSSEAWRELGSAIERSDAEQRAQMLSNLTGGFSAFKPENYTQRSLRLLRKYFDDPGRPKVSAGEYYLLREAIGSNRVPTVGQVAMWTAAKILNVLGPSEKQWTTDQWSQLRQALNKRIPGTTDDFD